MRKIILIIILLILVLAWGLFFVSRNNFISSQKQINLKSSQNQETGQKESLVNDNLQVSEANGNNEDATKEKGVVNINGEEKLETKEEEKAVVQTGIINKIASWGYQKSSGRLIDTIIIHSSYNAMGGDQYSVEKLIEEYKEYSVSPHYLIDRKGVVYRLVEDKNIAYHAGESKVPDGRTNVNSFSVGIEMMNTKDDKFTPSQYDALKGLIAGLKSKYSIKYVLGHSDIAKGRKDDPWNFEWNRLK